MFSLRSTINATSFTAGPKVKTLLFKKLIAQQECRGLIRALSSKTSTPVNAVTTSDSNDKARERQFSTRPGDGPVDFGHVEKDPRFDGGKPTIAYASSMPTSFSQMRHEQLLQLSVEGAYGARKEVLIRNIMTVDSVEYDEAHDKAIEIAKANREWMTSTHLPYHLGIGSATVFGLASFPLIFHEPTAKWFNHKYVTMEVPSASELDTYLEVGSWTWNWMEPIIGQASFIFLVLQFTRSQMMNLGLKPYGNFMMTCRGDRLVKLYPQYNSIFVRWIADADTLYGSEAEIKK